MNPTTVIDENRDSPVFVIPAKAGTQRAGNLPRSGSTVRLLGGTLPRPISMRWVPACAGMTISGVVA